MIIEKHSKKPSKAVFPIAVYIFALFSFSCELKARNLVSFDLGSGPTIDAASIVANQLQFTGSNLDKVTSLRFDDSSLVSYRLAIESASAGTLTASVSSDGSGPIGLSSGATYTIALSSDSGSIKIKLSFAYPSGAVAMFNLSSCPTGWSPADGTAGNPDLRGRTIIGAGQGTGLTNRVRLDAGGEESHTLTVAELPSHNHALLADNVGGHTVTGVPASNFLGVRMIYSDAGGPFSPDPPMFRTLASGAIGNTGGDGAHNTMMPFAAFLSCVKD